jgi:putative molybdopterin biosynthesis protein
MAGIHLMDPKTGTYNTHLLTDSLTLVPGYGRMQGIVFRYGDSRFEGRSAEAAVNEALADPECTMVSRNTGSGTRIIIDKLLGPHRPPGYGVQTRSHNAVAAAVEQGWADWGVAISTVATSYGLGFLPLQEERYDFVVPASRRTRPAVIAFCEAVNDTALRAELKSIGFLT